MSMETMQPTLKNGRNVWNKINMPQAEFKDRLGRIRAGMEKLGIDALLVYGYGLNTYADPAYVSNATIRLPNGAMVVVSRSADPVLIFEGSSRGLPSVRETTWVKDIRPAAECSREAVRYLEERKLLRGTLGLCGVRELMPAVQLRELTTAMVEGRIVEAGEVLRDLRLIKSTREQDQIRRAAAIVAQGFDQIRTTSFSRMDEAAVAHHVRRNSHFEGAEDVRVLVGRPNAADWRLNPPERVPVRSGDPFIIYLACSFERYWAEGIRTFMAKESSFVDAALPGEGARLYQSLVEALKPEQRASDVAGNAMSLAKGAGVSTVDLYGLGEGIGLSASESPLLALEDDTELREGMCLTLRLATTDPSMGAAMEGNTFLLDEDGAAALTK
jgi:Xaa-Pro aminopeptidase